MKHILPKLAVIVLALSALLPLSGCKTNEATGRNQLLLLSWEEEAQMGAEAAPEFIEQGGGELPDQQVLSYVRDLGGRLAAESEMADIAWEFHVLDSAVINAFALPGGKVFVSRGLMEKMNNEAQLAGVMGHEIGHVTARHGNERMSAAMGVQLVVVGAAIGGAASDTEWGQYLGLGTAAGGQLFLLRYSRDNELEADALGVRYMARLGYNPVGQIEVMKILDEASGGAGGPEWLSTHPYPETRIARLEALIPQQFPDFDQTGAYVFREHEYKQHILDPLSKLPPPAHGQSAFIGPDEIYAVAGITWDQAEHRGCACHAHTE